MKSFILIFKFVCLAPVTLSPCALLFVVVGGDLGRQRDRVFVFGTCHPPYFFFIFSNVYRQQRRSKYAVKLLQLSPEWRDLVICAHGLLIFFNQRAVIASLLRRPFLSLGTLTSSQHNLLTRSAIRKAPQKKKMDTNDETGWMQ